MLKKKCCACAKKVLSSLLPRVCRSTKQSLEFFIFITHHHYNNEADDDARDCVLLITLIRVIKLFI